jgi:DNA-directed RNA polymerase subunit L
MAELLNMRSPSRDEIEFELKGVPVSFANALRRIILSNLDTVVIKDVQVFENTSQLPHEMLRHRVEMLPINVRPGESRIISEAKLELRIPSMDTTQTITTKHFTVHGDRKDILLKDEDGNDLLFVYLNPGEKLHLTARLGIDSKDTSQVSTVSYGYHIDPELAKANKIEFLKDVPESEKEFKAREFDNFHIQRSYPKDENDQPFWYDFILSSWGVIPPKEMLRQALALLKGKIEEWGALPVAREGTMASLTSDTEKYTIGPLIQRVIDDRKKTSRVFYDPIHPLLAKMTVKFATTESPESVVADAVAVIAGWCDTLTTQLSR